MLWVCASIDNRKHQKVVGKSVTYMAALCATPFVLITFWHDLWSITKQTLNKVESFTKTQGLNFAIFIYINLKFIC